MQEAYIDAFDMEQVLMYILDVSQECDDYAEEIDESLEELLYKCGSLQELVGTVVKRLLPTVDVCGSSLTQTKYKCFMDDVAPLAKIEF